MARKNTFRTWDDYFIPGTSVLRNKFTEPGKPYGETDQDKLTALEEYHTRARLIDLWAHPIAGRFDYEHMKAVHAYIFQDVYEWAGQPRVGPVWPDRMTKSGPNVLDPSDPEPAVYGYYPGDETMIAAAEAEYQRLADHDLLRGLNQDEFVAELAESWGELNTGGSALLGEELIGAHDE